ncbi:MAG: hypothetical protein IJF11_01020 [Clostridia bacterium]|nr:hypothetical protein [Clostridia bacterium]
MKRAIKLSIVFVMSLILCMIFAVIASAETYTVKYCQVNGTSKATATTDENGKITLRDTSVTTTDGKVFYGWFTSDGTFYKPGEEVTFTENTNLKEAYAYVIKSVEDLQKYVKSAYRNSLVRLDVDLEINSSTGLPGWEANNGTTCIYFDLNGHTITAKGTGDLFSATRMYMQFFNFDSENEGKIIANELKSTDGIYSYGKHGSGDSQSYGIVVGKNVRIETTGSLFKIPNDYCTTGSGAGFTCPNVKIWGTVVAHSLVNCNTKRTMLSNVDIYSGADVTLTGDSWWINPRTDYTTSFADFMIEPGAKFTTTNDNFNWLPSNSYLKYVEYDVKGGTFNAKLPDEFLKDGYESVYNAETGYYTVEYVACTVEGSNGVHNYVKAEYCDGLVPTCTEDGLAYFRCGCGSYYVDNVDALGHDYSIIEIVTPATLSTTGTKKYTCANCGDTYTQDYVADATDALATIVVKDENGEEKIVSVPFNSLFIITANSDGSVTLNGIADTIVVSETESYTKNDIVKLEIFGVTIIATGAIKDMSALTEVVIADGTKITFETASFDTCASLEKLVLGNGTIATFKQFTVKSSVTNTADNAGNTVTTPTCPNFAIIDARGADVTFENLAFRFNGAIKHVLMSEGNTYYFGRFAFHRSALEEVILPDNSTVTLSIKSFAETKTLKYVYVGANCLTNRSNGKIALGDDSSNTSVFGGNAVLSKVVLMDVEYIGKWTLSVKTSGDYAAKNDLYIYSHADSLTFNTSDCSINDRNAYNVFIYANGVANTPKNCHYVIYAGIPHKYVAEDSQPTCTLPGVAGYTIDCPCGVIENGEYTVTAYSSYTGDTTGGTITITGEIIPANGHEFDPANGATLISQTEAKCGEKSVATYKCANCDETTSVEVGEAKEHTAGATTTVPPTCTVDGLSQITCSLCNQVMSAEVISATGHTATGEWVVIENGTCTVGQTRVQYCKNDGCDAVVLSETDEPVGHTSNGEWIYEVTPDCLNGGVKYQRCTVCRAICETEAIDALGHEFDINNGAFVSEIKYAEGFNKTGTTKTTCARCEETQDGECAPIFTAKGYSVNNAGNSLNGGYTVDIELLKAYIGVSGSIEFGIVIANANTFNGSFFDGKVVNNEKALQVSISPEYSNFDCSIDFGTTSNSTLELIICAYVIDENGNASFIQAENDYALEVTVGSQLFTKVTLDLVATNVVEQPDAILPTNDEE